VATQYTPRARKSKMCKACGKRKRIGEFYPISRANPRPRSHCKECYRHLRPADTRKRDQWFAITIAFRRRPEGGAVPSISQLRATLGEPHSCYLCGEELSWPTAALDHVLPLSRGGTHTPTNLRWAHRACNRVKSDLTVEELCALASRILAHHRGS
jgi:5-methylcytosine-specific restriction endonuclease McrA